MGTENKTSRKKVILICGPKGSGKTSFAEDLQLVMRDSRIIGLADCLKDACAAAFGVDRAVMDDPVAKEAELDSVIVLSKENLNTLFKYFGVAEEVLVESDSDLVRPHINKIFTTLRTLLQYCGTEVLQRYSKTLMVERSIQDFMEDTWYLIPDIRFWHEVDIFCNPVEFDYHFYYTLSHRAELVASQAKHVSEKEYREFKHLAQVVDNNGDRMSLQMQARKIAKSLLEKTIT